jgi:disulfide bond formation protein DsbB
MAELPDPRRETVLPFLNYAYLLSMLTAVAGILTAAMAFQYGNGEIPCPLCLLQRVAMFGVCFCIMQNFRPRFSYRNIGLALVATIFLLVIAARQTLLDIYPRPGHAYIGSAVFGIHMPVWSVIVALLLLAAFAFELAVIGSDRAIRRTPVSAFPMLDRLATILSLYVIAICIVNFVSVLLQCGVGECHTFGYRLLQ